MIMFIICRHFIGILISEVWVFLLKQVKTKQSYIVLIGQDAHEMGFKDISEYIWMSKN